MNHFCKGVPVVLVGCKTDLRQDQELLRKLKDGRRELVSRQQVGVTSQRGGTGQRDSRSPRRALTLRVPSGRGHGPAGPGRVLHGMLGQVPG